MLSKMEQHTPSNQRQEEIDFDLRDELLKTCITRENTNSRRFSASNMTSFREESRSFRHASTISSTPSSPGYTSRDYIDPSTYSFTAALKALQKKSKRDSLLSSINSISNENPLHSKWNEAERYICNPLSGQVPIECLSAKTLSGRALVNSRRMTLSAPMVFSHARLTRTRPTIAHEEEPPITELESYTRIGSHRFLTRDVGTQSTPPDLSPSSTSPDSGLPIKEISLTSCGIEGGALIFHDDPKLNGHEVDFEEDAWQAQLL